jgi:hypothetical protein
MDRREAEQVVVNAAQAWVGGQILGVLMIAALPIVGWALLLGLMGAIAYPGAAMLIVAGLVVWGWAAGRRRDALDREASAMEEKRFARIKALHGGKDRYFIREGHKITLMRFDRGNSGLPTGYYWAGSYTLPERFYLSSEVPAGMRDLDSPTIMWLDPKRLERWQTVFDEWIETGVKNRRKRLGGCSPTKPRDTRNGKPNTDNGSRRRPPARMP